VRTLIQLIIRNHRLVLFVLLEMIALSWVTSTHSHPRGTLAKIGMEMSTNWTDVVGRIIDYKDFKKNNSSLLIENARLRTENMSYRSLSMSSRLLHSRNSWESTPAEIIRYPTSFKNNVLVANKGSLSGLQPGMGMLENGVMAGLITEVSVNHSLVLPIIHLSTNWSVRLGYDGAVGILNWSGESVEYATLTDIPLSEHILPGDSVITSGFQGTFPSGILVGKVEELIVTEADEFQSVTIKLSADYKRIHYVEFLSKEGAFEVDSLLSKSSP